MKREKEQRTDTLHGSTHDFFFKKRKQESLLTLFMSALCIDLLFSVNG